MRFDGIEMNGSLNGTQTTLASAATVNIGAAAANSILITGTTNISAFDTIQAGTVRTLAFLDPAQSLTLVHSSNLLLPNNADFLVAEGYVMEFTSLGAGAWKCTGIQFNYIPQNIASRADTPDATWGVGNFVYSSVSGLVQYSGTEITMADLITLRDAAGMATNQRFIITDSTPSYLMVTAYGTSTLSPTAIRYSDINTAEFGTYDLDTDTFTSIVQPIPSYLTLDLATWTALVAANGLIPGWRYRVTSAYEFDAFGFKDIVVTADSVNTVEDTGYVIISGVFVPYTVDSTLSNPGFFLYSYPTMALTGTQALAYSGYNWKFNAGLQMYLTDGSFYFQTEVQSDPAAIVFDNVKAIDANGTVWLAGDFGTYDPNTDTFTPNASVWAPTPTSDGSVVTSPGTLSAGKISKNGNVMSYSFLLTGVTMDFTGSNTGFVEILDSDFPFLPTGDHVVSGQLSEPGVVGIAAISGSNLRIYFVNRSGSLLTTDVSINGQCLL